MKKERLDNLLYEIGNDDTYIPPEITSKTMNKIKNNSRSIYAFIGSFSICFILLLIFIFYIIFSKDSYILKLKVNFAVSAISNIILIAVFAFKNKMCLFLKKLDE